MKYKLLIALLLISLGVRSQTSWTNVGNGLQQRVVAGKTEYRFTKISPYAPFGITDSLGRYLPLSGGNMTGNINYFLDSSIPVINPNSSPGMLWYKNTDYAKIYFESTGSTNGSSNLIFENGNDADGVQSGELEGFIFRKLTNPSSYNLFTIQPSVFKYKNFDVLHTGNVRTVGGQTLLGSGNIAFPVTDSTQFRTVSNSYSLAQTQTKLNLKANLAGGNTFTGDQSITGIIRSTGDNTRSQYVIESLSTISGSGYRGSISLGSYNVDGLGNNIKNSIVANPSTPIGGSSNQAPATSGTMLNNNDALNYVKYGNNGSGNGGNAGISFGNDNSYFQAGNTSGNANTKIDPLGLSISNNGFTTKFIAQGTNTGGANVSVRNITGVMALTSDITANNVTYPVNAGGETLQSITTRGNVTTTGATFGTNGAATPLTSLGGGVATSISNVISNANTVQKLANPAALLVSGYHGGDYGFFQGVNTSSVAISLGLQPFGGNVAIGLGTGSPSEKLHVIGNILASGNITANSDSTLKKNIVPIVNASDKLSRLHGFYFNWKDTGRADIGVIAQEVQKEFPELVKNGNDGILSVNYMGLAAPLIQANNEQEKRIKNLENQLYEIINRNHVNTGKYRSKKSNHPTASRWR